MSASRAATSVSHNRMCMYSLQSENFGRSSTTFSLHMCRKCYILMPVESEPRTRGSCVQLWSVDSLFWRLAAGVMHRFQSMKRKRLKQEKNNIERCSQPGLPLHSVLWQCLFVGRNEEHPALIQLSRKVPLCKTRPINPGATYVHKRVTKTMNWSASTNARHRGSQWQVYTTTTVNRYSEKS